MCQRNVSFMNKVNQMHSIQNMFQNFQHTHSYEIVIECKTILEFQKTSIHAFGVDSQTI